MQKTKVLRMNDPSTRNFSRTSEYFEKLKLDMRTLFLEGSTHILQIAKRGFEKIPKSLLSVQRRLRQSMN